MKPRNQPRLDTSLWLLAASLALLWLTPACSKAPIESQKASRDEMVAVTVAKVELFPLDRTLPVVGTLCPMNEATVAAQVEGQLEKTEADFGDLVSAGQELALIDTASYEALAAQAAAALAKAKANALNAEHTLRRVLELQQSKISSASDFDSATAGAEQARAEVKAAEASQAVAQLNLRRSRVIAPFAGTLSERVANAGDYVKIGAALYRLVEDSELKFVVQAPERYAAQVKPGQLVHLTVDAWPERTFEGKVFLISPSVSTATRSFNLGARVQNLKHELKANTFARGDLILERAVPTPVIPLEAVVNFAGVARVFVIRDGAVSSREIKAGRTQDGRQEVLGGLSAGELVATSGLTKLYEKAKVRILSGERSAASS